MDSGKLDKKISFYKAAPVQSETTGTLTNTPVLQLTTWAQMVITESLGSSKASEAGETVFNDEIKFKIRKRSTFAPDKTMYILYAGLKYNIIRVKDKQNNNDPFIYVSTTVQT